LRANVPQISIQQAKILKRRFGLPAVQVGHKPVDFAASEVDDLLVFSSLEAVKTLEAFLVKNRESLGVREVTREKVLKVCARSVFPNFKFFRFNRQLCQILVRDRYIELASEMFADKCQNAVFSVGDDIFYRFSFQGAPAR